MILNSDSTAILGVVPVFVNTGAALLPVVWRGDQKGASNLRTQHDFAPQ
jgi:hypothetical protein